MALKDKAEAYFGNINSMANRMTIDMKQTKLSYENLWQTLSYEEQQQILNQSIIKPEISLKYPHAKECDPKKTEFAVKKIVDDNCMYRDEHSGPFSFHTSSQRDLTIFSKKISPKKGVKVIPPKAIAIVIPPKVIIAPQESSDADDGDTDSLSHFLPKTGLDMLDNW
ncbi:PREDICTED: uncharacterized protein C1orf198 homolog [Nicrophorus vespilloides]|uniref:Uncharacterized protein C1orf198 homolog n=1 Tax=Nicrophorus vespilloides TaxID=110193 RepID=A0ABM1MER7_NICVS|nr:PREDICTED: uncharacterized protein C1orf198 homolog [Nicrophorus vespilloides]